MNFAEDYKDINDNNVLMYILPDLNSSNNPNSNKLSSDRAITSDEDCSLINYSCNNVNFSKENEINIDNNKKDLNYNEINNETKKRLENCNVNTSYYTSINNNKKYFFNKSNCKLNMHNNIDNYNKNININSKINKRSNSFFCILSFQKFKKNALNTFIVNQRSEFIKTRILHNKNKNCKIIYNSVDLTKSINNNQIITKTKIKESSSKLWNDNVITNSTNSNIHRLNYNDNNINSKEITLLSNNIDFDKSNYYYSCLLNEINKYNITSKENLEKTLYVLMSSKSGSIFLQSLLGKLHTNCFIIVYNIVR